MKPRWCRERRVFNCRTCQQTAAGNTASCCAFALGRHCSHPFHLLLQRVGALMLLAFVFYCCMRAGTAVANAQDDIDASTSSICIPFPTRQEDFLFDPVEISATDFHSFAAHNCVVAGDGRAGITLSSVLIGFGLFVVFRGGSVLPADSSGFEDWAVGRGGLLFNGFETYSADAQKASGEVDGVSITVRDMVFGKDAFLTFANYFPINSNISIFNNSFQMTTQNRRNPISDMAAIAFANNSYPLIAETNSEIEIAHNTIVININSGTNAARLPVANKTVIYGIGLIGKSLVMRQGSRIAVTDNRVTSTIDAPTSRLGGVRYMAAFLTDGGTFEKDARFVFARNEVNASSYFASGTTYGMACHTGSFVNVSSNASIVFKSNRITISPVRVVLSSPQSYIMGIRVAGADFRLVGGASVRIRNNTIAISNVRIVRDILVIYCIHDSILVTDQSVYLVSDNALHVEDVQTGICLIEMRAEETIYTIANFSSVQIEANRFDVGPNILRTLTLNGVEILSSSDYRSRIFNNSGLFVVGNSGLLDYGDMGTTEPIFLQGFSSLAQGARIVVQDNVFEIVSRFIRAVLLDAGTQRLLVVEASSIVIRNNSIVGHVQTTTDTINAIHVKSGGLYLSSSTTMAIINNRIVILSLFEPYINTVSTLIGIGLEFSGSVNVSSALFKEGIGGEAIAVSNNDIKIVAFPKVRHISCVRITAPQLIVGVEVLAINASASTSSSSSSPPSSTLGSSVAINNNSITIRHGVLGVFSSGVQYAYGILIDAAVVFRRKYQSCGGADTLVQQRFSVSQNVFRLEANGTFCPPVALGVLSLDGGGDRNDCSSGGQFYFRQNRMTFVGADVRLVTNLPIPSLDRQVIDVPRAAAEGGGGGGGEGEGTGQQCPILFLNSSFDMGLVAVEDNDMDCGSRSMAMAMGAFANYRTNTTTNMTNRTTTTNRNTLRVAGNTLRWDGNATGGVRWSNTSTTTAASPLHLVALMRFFDVIAPNGWFVFERNTIINTSALLASGASRGGKGRGAVVQPQHALPSMCTFLTSELRLPANVPPSSLVGGNNTVVFTCLNRIHGNVLVTAEDHFFQQGLISALPPSSTRSFLLSYPPRDCGRKRDTDSLTISASATASRSTDANDSRTVSQALPTSTEERTSAASTVSLSGHHHQTATGRGKGVVRTITATTANMRRALSRTASVALTPREEAGGDDDGSSSPISPTILMSNSLGDDDDDAQPLAGALVVAVPPGELTQSAVDAGTAVGVGTLAVGGVVSPIVVTQQGVALALARMAQCDANDEANDKGEPLALLVHPLQFGLGEGDGRYGRGALLGNLILIPMLWCVASFVVGPWLLMRITADGDFNFATGRDFLGWPGNMAIPLSIFAEGSAFAAMGLVVGGDGSASAAGDIVFGIVGFILLAAFFCVWLYHLIVMRRTGRIVIQFMPPLYREEEKEGPSSLSFASSWVGVLLKSRWEWIMLTTAPTDGGKTASAANASPPNRDGERRRGNDGNRDAEGDGLDVEGVVSDHNNVDPPNDDDDAVEALDSRGSGLPIPPYLQRRLHLIGGSWWLWSSLCAYSLSALVGVCEGIPATSDLLCKLRWVLACICALLQAAVVLTGVVPLEVTLLSLSALLLLMLSIVITLTIFNVVGKEEEGEDGGGDGNSSASFNQAMNIISTLSSVVGIVLMVVGVVETVMKLLSWRVGRREKRQKMRAVGARRRYLLDADIAVGGGEEEEGEGDLALLPLPSASAPNAIPEITGNGADTRVVLPSSPTTLHSPPPPRAVDVTVSSPSSFAASPHFSPPLPLSESNSGRAVTRLSAAVVESGGGYGGGGGGVDDDIASILAALSEATMTVPTGPVATARRGPSHWDSILDDADLIADRVAEEKRKRKKGGDVA